jgi:hypothetical protein
MTKEETWAILVVLGVVEGESTETEWNLHDANLGEADLTEANLSEANLRGANFSGADLGGADLSGADLGGADLSECYFGGAELSGANFHGANLAFAYLAGANLSGADLSGADLSGADLSGADLTDATLIDSVLINTDLTGANLSGACIDNATISGWIIKDVTCSHIIEAESGKEITIGFEPLEFERKYAQIQTTVEVVTHPAGGTSMTDVQRLIEKYEKRMAELEAQIGALRHKHDILVEASRLLEEEAQAPDVSSQ